MSELLFNRETQALVGQAGEIARVEPASEPDTWGRIVVADEEFGLGRHAHHGWAFQVESGQEPLWRFHAGWRRGGRLVAGRGGSLRLSSSFVRTGRWMLRGGARGRARIQRHDRPLSLPLREDEQLRDVGSGAGWLTLAVEADGVFWEEGDGVLALTFACWLVGEWEETRNMGGSPI